MEQNGNRTPEDNALTSALQLATERLAVFSANNPASTIEIIKIGTRTVAVKAPWGDQSMAILIPATDSDALIDALNNVRLPERYTAIWHGDSETFEVIYTAFPLPLTADVASRAFTFKHKGFTYECRFGGSSTRVLLIAEHFRPIAPPTASFRNLLTFQLFVRAGKRAEGNVEIPGARALSFWIKGLKWDDDAVLDLVTHLNFYMAYYDTQSPQILVHSPSSEAAAIQPRTRFRDGVFPQQITARPIQENLLHFWNASNEGDPIRCFLNNYLIIESAAFFYIGDEIKRTVKKTLLAPNATESMDLLTERILEAVSEDKLDLNQKIEALLRRCVDSGLIWREFEKNLAFFCETIRFDGGFVLDPIATKATNATLFAVGWSNAFEKNIRSIRNALSHGKEQRTLATITPTAANFERLRLWLPPIAVAAREVMVYRDLA
jgi:hypothetical protein